MTGLSSYKSKTQFWGFNTSYPILSSSWNTQSQLQWANSSPTALSLVLQTFTLLHLFDTASIHYSPLCPKKSTSLVFPGRRSKAIWHLRHSTKCKCQPSKDDDKGENRIPPWDKCLLSEAYEGYLNSRVDAFWFSDFLFKLNALVAIDPDHSLAQRLADLGQTNAYSLRKLSSGEEVGELFPEPHSRKHLHIVVQRDQIQAPFGPSGKYC